MQNMGKYLLLVGMISMTTHALDINCLQLPTTHVRYLQTCCHFPRLKFHIYDRQCAHVATKSGIFGLDRYFNPCALACVFNASGMMPHKYSLNLTRVHSVLQQLMDDQPFVSTYNKSFHTCLPIVRAKIDKTLAKGRTGILDGRRCSNLPIMYGICAHAQTFLNCPRSAWMDTKPCNEMRKYLSDCIGKI